MKQTLHSHVLSANNNFISFVTVTVVENEFRSLDCKICGFRFVPVDI